jgi:hypothetical protein
MVIALQTLALLLCLCIERQLVRFLPMIHFCHLQDSYGTEMVVRFVNAGTLELRLSNFVSYLAEKRGTLFAK